MVAAAKVELAVLLYVCSVRESQHAENYDLVDERGDQLFQDRRKKWRNVKTVKHETKDYS